MNSPGSSYAEIRKLRKKLRQIENLERIDRELSDEEKTKVYKKYEIRANLQDLLAQLPEDSQNEEEEPSFDVSETEVHMVENDEQEYEDDDEEVVEDEVGEQEMIPSDSKFDSFTNEGGDAKASSQEKASSSKDDINTVTIPGPSGDSVAQHPVKRRADSPEMKVTTTVSTNDASPAKKPKATAPGKEKKTEQEEAKQRIKEQQRSWRSSKFNVIELNGHNDLVCSVDGDRDFLVTGSRDTMVKVWDLKICSEIRSFGSHTGTVTSVIMLSHQESQKLWNKLKEADNSLELPEDSKDMRIVMSGSQDCSLKIWITSRGMHLKSLYVYNPITCMAYIPEKSLIAIGSDGGKLELWDPIEGCSVKSLNAHEDAVTSLKCSGSRVCSASADGIIKVFELKESGLHLMFESEHVKLSSGDPVLRRHIRSLAIVNGMIYYGDDGNNVKVLDWKKGQVHKLGNHLTEFGATDALCACEKLLLASGYDIDNGLGYINARCLPEERYMCTLDDEDTSRIICVKCLSMQKNKITFVTSGAELKVWRQLESGQEGSDETIHARFTSRYDRPPKHSDIESEGDTSIDEGEDEEDDISDESFQHRKKHESEQEAPSGWFSWCTLL